MLRKAIFLTIALSAAVGWEGRASSHPSDEVPYVSPKSPAVREKLEWFRDQKLCLMMHFGVYSILGIPDSKPHRLIPEIESRIAAFVKGTSK